MKGALLVICLLTLSGCSGTFKHTLNFNPSEPLRVAVLPFLAVDTHGKPVELESRLLLDNLALVSSEQSQTPLQIVRKEAIAEFSKTDLDLVSSALIDIDLPHHGYITPDGKLDVQRVWATSPKELCTKFMNCDAVLYGKVTRWDRSYYGVQTVNTVGIELRLVSAVDGKVLFQTTGEDTESRGVTKGPTGFSSLLFEPVKGLDSQIIVDLSQAVMKKMVAPLQTTQRPKFLEEAPPSIYAASHDAENNRVGSSGRLVVVVYGTPHNGASFSIGDTVNDVPMFESSPGHYYGEFIPQPGDSFSAQVVTIRLSDVYGRTTEQPLTTKPITMSGAS